MYVVVKVTTNPAGVQHFSMLSANGTYVDDSLNKAIIFSTAALATKQKEVLAALNPNDTFEIRQVVLQEVS